MSAFWLHHSAQKCFEWLLRRYRVQEMNVEACVQSILPYYATRLFARVVQLLDISRDSRWKFLQVMLWGWLV